MTSRTTAMAGFAFGPLLIIALLLGTTPDTDRSDAHWVGYFTDGGHQARLITAGALLVLAALAWVPFSTGLRERAAAGPVVTGFAALAAAGISLGGLFTLLVPAILTGGAQYAPDADVLRILTAAGYACLAFCGMPAAALAVALSVRAAALPRALTAAALVVCVLQLAALYYLPMLLFALWTLATAAVLARRPLKIPLPA